MESIILVTTLLMLYIAIRAISAGMLKQGIALLVCAVVGVLGNLVTDSDLLVVPLAATDVLAISIGINMWRGKCGIFAARRKSTS